jgi:galactonate dehydratase
MKIAKIEPLVCSAGWRPWTFIKISTDEGITGYSECTESFGSMQGLIGCIHDLGATLIGQDPRAFEKIYWDLYRMTRQSVGGVVHKAIGGIENALLDIKAKSLGIPVYELFGGPLRELIPVYWSHCGTTRARTWKQIGKEPLRSLNDVADLGREVVAQGYSALKTNIIIPGEPPTVIMQGFRGGYGTTDQNIDHNILDALVALIGTFRDAVGPKVSIALDLNFHFKTEGNKLIARHLEPFNLAWLEMDSYDPQALLQVRESTRIPIGSGEVLYTARDYRPYFDLHAMDIAMIDVAWNGLAQSMKIAHMAEIYEMNMAPHNHYSYLATFMNAHLCAAIPNLRILEVDVDDVPWKDDLVTVLPEIQGGVMKVPTGIGWGTDLDEEALKAHPWPA